LNDPTPERPPDCQRLVFNPSNTRAISPPSHSSV
jgi:hypothetical protein